MVTARRIAGLLLLAACAAAAQDFRLAVTVFDDRSGKPVLGLQASDFTARDGDTALRVVSAEYVEVQRDLLVLVDTSLVGEAVRPMIVPFLDGLREGDQMALIAYDQSATLLQDFTSSKDLLRRSLGGLKYASNPRALDALYAALDSGFADSNARRAVVLLSAGAEGDNRTAFAAIPQMARNRAAQIFCVHVERADASLYQRIAERTGGAYFNVKRLGLKPSETAALVHEVVRGRYEVTVAGVAALGDRVQVQVPKPPSDVKKAVATALVLD
jgi:hypothetical protein